MRDTKFVKARCRKTGAAFGIEVKQFGGEWKAVDFVQLTAQQDKKLESQIVTERLEAADSIQPCAVCGSRTVGGCDCAARRQAACRADGPYRYQCIFCRNLDLDYTPASEVREGEQITLSQGQVVTLTQRGVGISNLLVGMGWRPSLTSHNMDLDSSVAMIRKNGTLYDTVYFGHLSDAAGSIRHHGDNLTGSVKIDRQSDDENISVSLAKVPAEVQCLAFFVNIYKANERGQTLGDVRGVHIRLTEANSGAALAIYNTFQQNRRFNSLLIGAAYRVGDGWSFQALGECFNVRDVQQLAGISAVKCRSLLSR